MLENAVRICDATFGNIYRWHGDALHLLATHNTPPAFAEARKRSPRYAGPNTPAGRMVATRTVVHVADLAAEQAYVEERDPSTVAAVELGGVRTFLAVPMLKENELIGTFALARQEVRPFFNDPVPVENPARQAVLMALEMRDAIGALTATGVASGTRWFGIGIAHGFATLGTIGFEGRFDYAAIGTVSNVASRLCDEAKPGQILISPRVLTKVENAVKVEPVGEFELKGIRRPLAAYNVVAAHSNERV